MADDLLGGVLGGEEERPEVEAPQAAAGADAFAAAVAARLSGNDPGVARKTEAFLDEQTRLLATQRQHLEDEHALRLAQLAHQRSLLHGQRIGQAIRIAFQVVIALVMIVIGAGIAVMLYDAFTSHSVVIDAFDAPAALAARGVTGTVVASDVLDELSRLQDATRTAVVSKRSLTNAWSSEVRVDVPETGISLGELSRLLKARLGHDLHIGGELVETASGGLALTVRGGQLVPKTFTGSADDYHELVVDAAQYLFAGFQPYLWAIHLSQSGHCPDAIAFVESAYADADEQQRALFLYSWGLCRVSIDPSPASMRAALDQVRQAIELSPDLQVAYADEMALLSQLGEEEAAWRAGKALSRTVNPYVGEVLGQLTWDERRADPIDLGLYAAMVDVQRHDPSAAALALQTFLARQISLASDQNGALSNSNPGVHYVRGLLAEETGDVGQAADEMEAFRAAAATAWIAGPGSISAWNARCWIAPIEEEAGHPDLADAAMHERADEAARRGGHFVDCERFRGDILDHRGDWAGAQQAYAQAVALAPDLPAAYYSWGVALARHGDFGGAITKLQAANQRGPHWADPLKAWGDVLAKQGHWSDALTKYDEALKYAPNWAALKQARAAAAARAST